MKYLLIVMLGWVGILNVGTWSEATPNDNTTPAGTFANGVLNLELEAREVLWRPDGEKEPGLEVFAFAERGKSAQIPGPFIRAIVGTTVHVTIHNPLDRTLKVTGFHSRPRRDGSGPLVIPPGESRSATFQLEQSGAYFYWGTTTDAPAFARRLKEDSQLAGVIVVDEPAARANRVFVIGQYFPGDGPVEGVRPVSAINGRGWPHTERLTYNVGDTIRWHIVNLTNVVHPMHLHGFYFDVERRGDALRDTLFDAASRRKAVTERMTPGTTMLMSWQPDRAGNWLFHCHIPSHIAPRENDHKESASKGSPANHATDGMAGLVLGIHVQGEDRTDAGAAREHRRLRLIVEADAAETTKATAYRFRLDRPDALAAKGIGIKLNPIIVVRRNEPVAINVVNKLNVPTAVHWHGIELESYFDGVAGFGGHGKRIAPVIEAGDSFNVRFTPPRAGTFIYHTHVDEPTQERAGLSGALVVVDEDASFDPATDHVILINSVRGTGLAPVYINNTLTPRALGLRANTANRFRFINMMVAPPRGVDVTLLRDTTVMTWTPVAKDGADLPPSRTSAIKARFRITTGETYDFSVKLEPGHYVLELRDATTDAPLLGKREVVVR